MSETPLVYVVLVNWNSVADTAECLDSLVGLCGDVPRAIVVDNGSSDGSVERLTERFHGLCVIEAGGNLGFAGGANLGLEAAMAAGADFVWLLNNDTTVDPGALDFLLSCAAERPGAGMLGSKILYHGRPDTIWFAGGVIDPFRAGYPRHVGADQPDDGRFGEIKPVQFLSGCSLLVRRSVIEQIGLLRDDYFMYWEDVDWCARAIAAGWQCLYVPESRILHKVSASLRGTGHLDLRYETRNRLDYFRRNDPSRYRSVLLWTLRDVAVLCARGRWANAGARLAGVNDFLCGRMGRIAAG